MKFLAYIIRWSIAIAFFVVIFFAIAIGLLIYRPQQVSVLIRPICRAMIRAIGVRVKVTGQNQFDANKPYLIICNHESLLDPFLCTGYIPLYLVAIEIEEQFSWPVWGWLTNRWGNIPLNKESRKSVVCSFRLAEQRMKKGVSVLIFPEGTRTVTGEMGEFKKGAFHLARQTQADILPVAMNGLYLAKTRGDWRVRAVNVSVAFGTPLPYSEYRDWSVEELRDWGYRTVGKLKQVV